MALMHADLVGRRPYVMVGAVVHGSTSTTSGRGTSDSWMISSWHEVNDVGALPAGAGTLTVRECQVAALLIQGLSNKEIAAQLYIEVATVKNHVHHILGKLHVRRRGEAVARLAFGQG
jgi:DNA-binding NarL/FixJ family response regulator